MVNAMRIRLELLSLSVMAMLTIFVLYIVLMHIQVKSDYLALFFGYFASVGWITTNLVTNLNERKNRTMEAISYLRGNQEYHSNRHNLFTKIGYDTVLSENDVAVLTETMSLARNWRDDLPALESLNFILNALENFAYGVRYYHLDERILLNCVTSIYRNTFKDYSVYILMMNKKNPHYFENLIWLAGRIPKYRPL
jgi:hypothetical protein